jgi:hypothetical protein
MKIFFAILCLVLAEANPTTAQIFIDPVEANKHIGELVYVCGKVFSAQNTESDKNAATLLHIGADYPNQPLTIVIPGKLRGSLRIKPEDAVSSKRICISGRIESFEGKAQIVLSDNKDIALVEDDPYDKVFTKVEHPSTYPGGSAEWSRYLKTNLDTSAPSRDHAPAGNYSVKVMFIVDTEGNITQVGTEEVPGKCPSCGPEAVMAIKKSGRWLPAWQNGRNVVYQASQIIKFYKSD